MPSPFVRVFFVCVFFCGVVWCCVGGCGKERGYMRVGKGRGEKLGVERRKYMFGFGVKI